MKERWKHTWIRLTRPEFWPVWAFYLPVWLQHPWLSLRCGTPFFFLRTNPAIRGFILSDSKHETLGLVPSAYRPLGFRVEPGTSPDRVLAAMEQNGIGFPVVLKPDIGYRGIQVRKAEDPAGLARLLAGSQVPLLLQEYLTGDFEVGVFYHRLPGAGQGHITSVTCKHYPAVTGDGALTVGQLVARDYRLRLQAPRLQVEYNHLFDTIPAAGRQVPLGWVGNHNLGTCFTNGKELVNPRWQAVFDTLSRQMPGFYFGRFDIKADSARALEAGRFKILEVNGIGGEPTHMYDPAGNYFRAVAALCRCWRIAARIARKNMAAGLGRPGYTEANGLWQEFRSYRRKLQGSEAYSGPKRTGSLGRYPMRWARASKTFPASTGRGSV